MNFGQAIEALKHGKCMRRKGWNGKNMHIYLEEHFIFPVQVGVYVNSKRKYDACLCMFTAQGTHQPGWLASQVDMLAEDWEVVS